MKQKMNLYVTLLLFGFTKTFSQTGDVDPPPAAPIDDYVIHFAVIAVLLSAFFIYKKKLKTTTI